MTNKQLNAQFNIPAWVKGPTPADESRQIEAKFKDRKDKYSMETKEELLKAVADKQEYYKMQQALANESKQVPDQMNGEIPQGMEQFAGGGWQNYDPNYTNNAIGAQGGGSGSNFGGQAAGAAVGVAGGLLGNAPDNQYASSASQKGTNVMDTGKDAAASVVPLAGLFRGIEKGVVSTAGKTNGSQGENISQAMFSPSSNIMKLTSDKELTGAERAHGLFNTVFNPIGAGVIINKGDERRKIADVSGRALAANAKISGSMPSAYGGYIQQGCGGPGQPPCSDTIKKPTEPRPMKGHGKTLGAELFGRPFSGEEWTDFDTFSKELKYKFGTDAKEKNARYRNWEAYNNKVKKQDALDYVNRADKKNEYASGGYITDPVTDKEKRLKQDVNKSTGINFTEDAANSLFERNIPGERSTYPDVNLGRYKGSQYFDIKNQGANYIINPTSTNPQNAQGYNQQLAYLKSQNPGLVLDNGYQQFQNRHAGGGFLNNFDPEYLNNAALTQGPVNRFLQPQNLQTNVSKGLGPAAYDINQSSNQTVNRLQPQNLQTNVATLTPEELINQGDPKQKGQFFNKAANWAGQNYGNVMQYAPVIGNLTDKTERAPNPRRDRSNNIYNEQPVDEMALQNIAQNEYGNVSNSIRNASNGSAGALRSNLLGASLNKVAGLSNAYFQANNVNRLEGDKNFQSKQTNTAINLQQSNLDTADAQANEGAYQTAKSAKRAALFEDIGKIGKEEVDKKLVKEMFGYSWDGKYFKDNKGNIIKNDDGTPLTQAQIAAKITAPTLETTNKAMFGGYLKTK